MKYPWLQQKPCFHKMPTVEDLTNAEVVELQLGSDKVPRHTGSAFIDATTLCETRRRQFYDWQQTKKANAVIQQVSEITGLSEAELIIVTPNTATRRRTTWVHPRIAAAVAGWLDPMFAVYCVDMVTHNPQSPEVHVKVDRNLDIIDRMIVIMKELGGLEQFDVEQFDVEQFKEIVRAVLQTDAGV